MSEPENLEDVATEPEASEAWLKKVGIPLAALALLILTSIIFFDAGRTIGKDDAYKTAAGVQAADLRRQKQNIDHLRWLAASTVDDTAVPSDSVLRAAAQGDEAAVREMSRHAVAIGRLNDSRYACAALADAYNASAAALAKQPYGRTALNGLPLAFASNYCWNGEKRFYVPSFGQ